MTLAERLKEYITAAFSGIWLQSYEHEDALREIAQLCRDQKWALATWDIDRGLSVSGGDPRRQRHGPHCRDPLDQRIGQNGQLGDSGPREM
jgi:hypothetical protein